MHTKLKRQENTLLTSVHLVAPSSEGDVGMFCCACGYALEYHVGANPQNMLVPFGHDFFVENMHLIFAVITVDEFCLSVLAVGYCPFLEYKDRSDTLYDGEKEI